MKKYTLRVCSHANIVDVERGLDDAEELLADVTEYLALIDKGWTIEIVKNEED